MTVMYMYQSLFIPSTRSSVRVMGVEGLIEAFAGHKIEHKNLEALSVLMLCMPVFIFTLAAQLS